MKNSKLITENTLNSENYKGVPKGWIVYSPKSSITFQERVNENTTQPYSVVACEPDGLELYEGNLHPNHQHVGHNSNGDAVVCEGNWKGIQ